MVGKGALGEVAVVYAVVTLASIGIDRLGSVPVLREYTHLAIAALFLLSAVQLTQRQPGGLRRYGMRLGGVLDAPDEAAGGGPFAALADLAVALWRAAPAALRETGFALLLAALVFPPFVGGFYLWHRPDHAFGAQLPPELPSYLLAQLLVVGLPEEAFFRGYVQGRLSDHFQGRRQVLGARLSLAALVLQAALFGLIHFAVDLNPVRLAVFFPGLAFGWIRARRGGLGAAMVFHACSNLLSDVLVRGWL